MSGIPAELQSPFIERPAERWRSNWGRKTVLFPVVMAAMTSMWRVWFWNEVTEEVWYGMVGFWLVWTALYCRSCRDPGWVSEKTFDKYSSIYGFGPDGEISRSEVSEGSLNRVARFDHHNPWLGIDVGRENYLTYYTFIAWTALWGLTVFVVSIRYYALHNDWSRPWFIPPGVWEMGLMLTLFAEGYCRFMIFLYSTFSVALRHFLSLDHWLLLTYEFSKANFIWGCYYTPVFIGCLLSWYAFGYCSVFSLHGFLNAAWNLTFSEANQLTERVAVPSERFASMVGLLFLLWSDVVGAVGSMPYFRGLKVVPVGEAAPEGHLLLDRNNGFWDMWGTLPCSFSKHSKGTAMANIKDITSTTPLARPSCATRSLSQSIHRINIDPDAGVVVHDSTLASRKQ